MRTSEVIYREFVEKWTHPDYRPIPLTEAALDAFERRIGAKLPVSYREFMSLHGPVSVTSSLLSSIIAAGQKVPDFQAFLNPQEAIDQTQSWRALGLPRDRFAIASDSSGNLFCLKYDLVNRQDDAPIFFFDHDFGSNKKIFPSFVKWLDQIASVEKVDA